MDRFLVRGKRKRETEDLTASGLSGYEASTSTNGSAMNITSIRPVSEGCKDKVKDENNKKLEIPRAFSRWKSVYSWLSTNSAGKTICSICVEATNKKLLTGFHTHTEHPGGHT